MILNSITCCFNGRASIAAVSNEQISNSQETSWMIANHSNNITYYQFHSNQSQIPTILLDQRHIRTSMSYSMIKSYFKAYLNSPVQDKEFFFHGIKKYNGTFNHSISQCRGILAMETHRHSQTTSGACYSLTVHWIILNSAGNSLFNVLLGEPARNKLNITCMNSIKLLEIESGCRDITFQEETIRRWLAVHNILPIKNDNSEILKEMGELTDSNCNELLKSLIKHQDLDAKYITVSLKKKKTKNGHIFAVNFDEIKGIRLFEPNYGEFTFNNKETFNSWFSEEFWLDSGLGCGYDTFELVGYKHELEMK